MKPSHEITPQISRAEAVDSNASQIAVCRRAYQGRLPRATILYCSLSVNLLNMRLERPPSGKQRAPRPSRDALVKRALAKQEKQFNSLEIASVVSKRFLGFPFVSVVAHTRHIQQGARLVLAKDSVLEKPVPSTLQTKRQVEAVTEQYTALISNS